MQDIEFETDKNYLGGTYSQGGADSPQKSAMAQWLTKLGVTDPSLANYILVGVAGIFFGVTIFLYAGALSEPEKDWSLDARVIMEMQSR